MKKIIGAVIIATVLSLTLALPTHAAGSEDPIFKPMTGGKPPVGERP